MPELKAKDLSKEAPRSPFARITGFVILARALDKCRATIAGTNGEYHYDCALDKTFFQFKGIDAEQLKAQVAQGYSDEEIGVWVMSNGTPKTGEEIAQWSAVSEKTTYMDKPEKREWFMKECERLGLDPHSVSLFQYIDADDIATFK